MKSIWRSDSPQTRNPLKFFLYASRPHWKAAVAAILFATIGNIFSASVSYVFKLITNAAAALPDVAAYDDLLLAGIFYVAALSLAKIFLRISGFSGARRAIGAMETGRHSLT